MNENYTLINGDCLAVMAEFEADSIDAVVTDPPYGLSKEPNISEVLINWLAGKSAGVGGGGFMGLTWDGYKPGPEYWREVIRVLKPGAHALVFASPRTMDLMTIALRLAGFEIRDCIRSLHDGQLHAPAWLNAQGMAKTKHTLAPGWEPVIVARKPFKGSQKKNLEVYGVGGLFADVCRIPKAVDDRHEYGVSGDEAAPTSVCFGQRARVAYTPHPAGRLPKNVIHDGSLSVLDEMARYGKSKTRRQEKPSGAAGSDGWGSIQTNRGARGHSDSGTISRFYYCAKATDQDRNEGLELLPDLVKLSPMRSANGTGKKNFEGGFQDKIEKNVHETVKPTSLMLYLIRLCCPPGGIVLDPFAGSGSTGKAAGLGGFRFVGIEKEKRYFPIACARTAYGYAMRDAKPVDNQLDMFES